MTNAKTITKKISFALAAAGIALSAANVSAEEATGSSLSAESQALLALVSTGALKPVNIAIAEKRLASSSELNLDQAGKGALSPESTSFEAFMLKPQFTTASRQDTSPVSFSSLDGFIVSVTEQDRASYVTTFDVDGGYSATRHGALTATDSTNLLNSRFANLVARKLTGKK